jgi:two-component system sensor histidine kinase PilS (NtrC family)
VVVTSAVLAFAVAVDLGLTPQPTSATAEVLLYEVSAVTYAASFVLLLLTQLRQGQPRWLVSLAWASLLVDAAMALTLVHVTDGLQSLFLFGLPLAVLNAALLRSLPGALTAASLVAGGVAILAAGELGWVILPAWRVAYLTTLAPRPPLDGFEVISGLALQVAAAYGTALLASQLVRELDRAHSQAARQGREIAALQVRYDDVVSSLPDGVLTLDGDGSIASVNPAAERILMLESDVLVGHQLVKIVPELAGVLQSGATEAEVARRLPLEPGKTQQIQRTVVGGAEQLLACRVVPLRSPEEVAGVLVLLRDQTAVRAREAQHRARERLAAIGTMATAVAHEIRNPLAAISGSVQLLQHSERRNETDTALMQIVERETAQLSSWIGEFLDFARPRGVQLASCDLAVLARETVAACQAGVAAQQRDLTLTCLVPEEPGIVVQGDTVLLRQVLWNLLVNACQAMQAVGGGEIRVSLRPQRGGWLLAVDDNGAGIAEAERERIFEPFYTTKDSGTGLGLATVRRHVEAHHGRCGAETSPLGGARVWVWLPTRPPSGAFEIA